MKFIITESQHNRLLSEQKVYTSQAEYDKAMTRYEDGLKIYESEKLLKENLTLFAQRKLNYNDLKNFLNERDKMFNQIKQRSNNIFDRTKKEDDILKYFYITENKNNRLIYSFCLGKNGKLIEVDIEKLGKKLKTKKLISNQPCDSFSRFELSDFNPPIKPILNLPPAKSNCYVPNNSDTEILFGPGNSWIGYAIITPTKEHLFHKIPKECDEKYAITSDDRNWIDDASDDDIKEYLRGRYGLTNVKIIK